MLLFGEGDDKDRGGRKTWFTPGDNVRIGRQNKFTLYLRPLLRPLFTDVPSAAPLSVIQRSPGFQKLVPEAVFIVRFVSLPYRCGKAQAVLKSHSSITPWFQSGHTRRYPIALPPQVLHGHGSSSWAD